MPIVPIEKSSEVCFRDQHPFPRLQELDPTYVLGISENIGVLRLWGFAFYNSERRINEACTEGKTRMWRGRIEQ